MSIDIITGFDGSCPHSARGVKRRGPASFVVFPSLRSVKQCLSEEVKACGSRFWIRIANSGTRPRSVSIVADWQGAGRMEFHDIGHVRAPGRDWVMIPAIRHAEKARYRFAAPPGTTDLALLPEYSTADCRDFVHGLPRNLVRIEVAGRSRKGRPMYLLQLPSPNRRALPFFIQARDHAYESAGSYCMEGILAFLLSEDPLAKYIRSKFRIHAMPMTNPDGVHDGMSRLTWERGADMNRVHTAADKAHATLKRTIDKIRPLVHMNIHNWTHRHQDGLLANDEDIAGRIIEHLPADAAHYKRWMVQTHLDYLRAIKAEACPLQAQSWKNYCRAEFGAVGVNFEFPWFCRTTSDMRAQGRKAFIALALAVIETRHL